MGYTYECRRSFVFASLAYASGMKNSFVVMPDTLFPRCSSIAFALFREVYVAAIVKVGNEAQGIDT